MTDAVPYNLLQVRRILDDFLDCSQTDPEDVWDFTDHAKDCVRSTPEEFAQPDRLLALLVAALAVMDSWDWNAEPPLPQLADTETWWSDESWEPCRDLLRQARDLLPPIGEAERAELARQAALHGPGAAPG